MKYRILKGKELIEKGDQFKRGNRWLNATMFFGDPVSDFPHMQYRRKIK